MALRTRVFSAGKLFVLAGALAGTYLLFAAASMRLAVRALEVEVPDLANRTPAEATAIAGGLGLGVRVDDSRRPDPKVAAGLVMAQDPPPGATTRRQRVVRVWLSAGQSAATVPLLTGETERSAQMRLSQDGLDLVSVSEIRSPDYPSDVVVAQDPAARLPSAQVSLLVNRAERGTGYVMPDLIGVDGSRAVAILRNRGFRVAVVGSRLYPGVAAGVVLRQSPQAGFQITPGEPISLEVSR
jgi:beta-lactam-binding protein with PASTA domain